jgi:hypothetical protein
MLFWGIALSSIHFRQRRPKSARCLQMSRPADGYSQPQRNPFIQERRIMAQTLTFVSILAALAGAIWWIRRRRLPLDSVLTSVRLDHGSPGAHLICELVNSGSAPVTFSAFVIHPRRLGAGRGESVATVPLPSLKTLDPGDHAALTMDVDWRLLDARSIAACDLTGVEHPAPADQLSSLQTQLRQSIEHRAYAVSAREWLFGAANLAFGVVILGLGFFMLMWMIATG